MKKNVIIIALSKALQPRKNIWIFPAIIGLSTMAISFFCSCPSNNIDDLLMSFGGWILTLAGILFAGNQAARIALTDAFSKLYEIEVNTDQYKDKKNIYDFGRAIEKSNNKYLEARNLFNKLSKKKQEELNMARRRIKHFWLLAEAYYDSKIMRIEEVFSIAGFPEILMHLETLEVINAEKTQYPMIQGPWPFSGILKKWYKEKNQDKDIDLTMIPTNRKLYGNSLDPKETA